MKFLKQPTPVLSCLLLSLLAHPVGAAVYYWDNNGTGTPTSGTWDTTTAQWSASSSLTASTVAWNTANAACFTAGSGVTGTINITVNQAITMAGIFNGQLNPPGCALTFNGSGSFNLAAGTQAALATGGSDGQPTVVNIPFTGPGQLWPEGSKNCTLNGHSTYSGGTVLNQGGLLFFSVNDAFGTGPIYPFVTGTPSAPGFTAILSQGSSTLTLANNFVIASAVSGINFASASTAPVVCSGTWDLMNSAFVRNAGGPTANLTLNGVISDVGALTLSANNVSQININGANTYGGGTTLSSGNSGVLVQLGNVSALGYGPVTVNSGNTLDLNGNSIGNSLTLNGTGTNSNGALINSSATPVTLNNGAVGSITVTAAGSGISAVPTVTISGGGGSGATGQALLGVTSQSFTINPGTQLYTVAPTVTISGAKGSSTGGGASTGGATATIALAGASPSVLASTVTITAAGSGFDPGTVPTITFGSGTKSGSGTLPTATGNTTHFVLTGVAITSPGSGYTSAPTVTIGGSSGATATATIVGTSLASTSGVGGAGNITINEVVSGTGGLTKVGAGTVTLTGANTYTGGTTVSAGTLSVGAIADSGTSGIGNSGTLTLSGGKLSYTGAANVTTTRAVTLSGTASILDLPAGNLEFTGAAKSGTFTKTGSGTLTLSGTTDNSSLGINVNGGTVVFNKASASGVHAIGATSSIGNGGTLQLSGTGGFEIYSGVALTVNSGGVFDVNGQSDSFKQLNLAGTGAGSGALINNSATTSALTLSSGVVLTANTLVGGSGNITLASAVSGTGFSLTQGGTGTLKLSAANTYTGGTIVNSGAVEVAGSLQGDVTVNSGTVQLDNATALANTSNLNLPAAPAANGNLSFTGTLPIGGLNFGAVSKAQGTWGSLSSAAQHKNAAFTGTGLLNVTTGGLPTTTVVAQTGGSNSCTYGDALTFTATVSGSGSPTGLVQFKADGVALGSPVALSGGVASLTTTALTVTGSPHNITASYLGDDNNNNSDSSASPVSVTVNQATLTVSGSGLLIYGNDPSNTVYAPTFSGFLNGDTASVVTGSADYSTDATATNYIGTNYIAHVVDLGTLAAANYSFTAGPDGVTTITNRPLWVSNALANGKVYDATTAATVDLSGASLTNIVNGDDTNPGAVSLNSSGATGAFGDKNVGLGKTVAITGLALAGDLGTNYVLIQPTTTTASITRASLQVSATGADKVYDGGNAATVTLSATPLGTDSVSPFYTTALFADKNVGTGKNVSVSGIGLTGPDAGNYTPNSMTLTTANITPASLTVGATGVNKVYDGGTAATVTLADNKVAGDDVTDSYTGAAFADKTVANGKPVSVSGISISGGDAGNYTLANTTASTTASITARTLTVTATGVDKVYDGGTAATVVLADNKVAGDAVTDAYTSAAFADKAVAAGKAVSVSGISISGGDAGNYTLASTTASTTASITARSLSVTATAANKAYDGTATASVTLSDNKLAGDAVTDSYTSATFADKNIGTGKTVTVSGISISGTDAGNYALGNTTATATADITGVGLTVAGAEAADKVYNGNTSATLILSNAVLVGVAGSDDVTLITTNALGAFADKNVGTNKVVTISGLGIAGADAGNYTLTQPTTNASITPAALTVTATAANKVYDGGTAASATLADNKVAGDDVSESYTTAAFADKNAAAGKTVTVSGISASGADIGNYTLANTTTTATADITAATLTISATGVNKVYDGTTAATVTLADNKVAGDDVTDSYTAAAFVDKNVAAGIAVSVSGLSISGADAGNYTLASTTASTTANITVRTLTVSATGVNKVYDGTTAATVTLSDDKVAGDDVTDSYTSAAFADANVGTGKAVSVSGISISGGAAGNYSLASTSASTTADITGAASSTALASSLNPSTQGSNVTFTATVSSGAGTPAGDVVFLANGVPFSTNTLVAGVAAASTATLPVGTNTISAQYAAQNNWLLSSATLQQVVNSAIVYSQTNAVLGIVANGNGTYTLSLLGTPGASYYVVSSADLTAAAWSALTYSTNTAPSPSGQWSVVVSNAAPAFFRAVAVNPAP